MPRFVILAHDFPEPHFDFMLEAGEILKTWKLLAPPAPGKSIRAQATFDHRLVYLDYEGEISGNRGAVVRWDRGVFTWEENEEGHIRVNLQGENITGTVDLLRGKKAEWKLTMKS